MLIGSIEYFRYPNGARLNQYDSSVPASAESSTPEIVAVWSCQNGDHRDVRYYLDHRQMDSGEVERFERRRAAWT